MYGSHKNNDALKDFKAVIVKAFPIMIGYLPIAISFGIIAILLLPAVCLILFYPVG